MSRSNYRRRHLQTRRQRILQRILLFLIILLLVGGIGTGIFIVGKKIIKGSSTSSASKNESILSTDGPSDPSSPIAESDSTTEETTTEGSVEPLLAQAQELADMYDYDAAITLLSENEQLAADPQVQAAITSYEETKATLVRVDPSKITHVFFHTLIVDSSKAFDGDYREGGYNQVMTTKDEFIKIMQSMYDRGFVLVRLHDMAYEVTNADGSTEFKTGDIMLPPDKKAFVLSQDDVCYYEYMEGDGFASRIVLGEDGKPTCEMKMDDGTVSVGEYDVVPVLERFIQEHPGFSYKGARGVLAFTGYNGILGYRTAASYSESPTYEEDRAAATKVAQALRDAGWELASHSWGHRNMGTISFEEFKNDTDKWETEVESLTGPTDIILFPFGSDVGGWQPYADDNERFQYLKKVGFRYFCNVDSSQYWVQIGKDHLRQGRRNLDGYRMYYDMVEPDIDRLGDLFDVNEVFDSSRPQPVPPMGS